MRSPRREPRQAAGPATGSAWPRHPGLADGRAADGHCQRDPGKRPSAARKHQLLRDRNPRLRRVIAAFAAGAYAGRRVAAGSVTRRPRWLCGLAAVVYAVPVAIFVRIAADHIAAHAENDNSWAAMAGGILAMLCTSGVLLMLGRAIVPGRWRRAFWIFPPLWLDQELGSASSVGGHATYHGSGAPISG